MTGVVHTFGKGVGLHGAALLTSHESLIGTLLNYCKPLIYSTSLPVSSVLSIRAAYDEMENSSHLREKLIDLTTIFRDECEKLSLNILPSLSPIQGILIPTNAAVMAAACTVKELGYTCLPIRAPTVPEGSERLRIILHAHNSEEEVIGLCAAIKQSLDRLQR
jgi:8-amino-7-oxononanoate synthase